MGSRDNRAVFTQGKMRGENGLADVVVVASSLWLESLRTAIIGAQRRRYTFRRLGFVERSLRTATFGGFRLFRHAQIN